jgi:hypothetical protein
MDLELAGRQLASATLGCGNASTDGLRVLRDLITRELRDG